MIFVSARSPNKCSNGLGWNHQLDEVDDLKGDNQQKIKEEEFVPKWFWWVCLRVVLGGQKDNDESCFFASCCGLIGFLFGGWVWKAWCGSPDDCKQLMAVSYVGIGRKAMTFQKTPCKGLFTSSNFRVKMDSRKCYAKLTRPSFKPSTFP